MAWPARWTSFRTALGVCCVKGEAPVAAAKSRSAFEAIACGHVSNECENKRANGKSLRINRWDAADSARMGTSMEGSPETAKVVHDKSNSRPLLLFCHATGYCKELWGPVISHLRTPVKCIALDHAGHGNSRGMPAGQTWEEWSVQDIQSVISEYAPPGTSNVVAVGHSMGAAAITNYELRHPGTFAHAVLFEPALFSSQMIVIAEVLKIASWVVRRPLNPLVAATVRRRSSWDSAADARRSLTRAFPNWAPAAADAWLAGALRERADGGVELKCNLADEASCYAIGGTPAPQRLARHGAESARSASRRACDFTLVAGEDSAFGWGGHVGADYYANVLAPAFDACSSVHYRQVEEATHFLVMEKPAQVAELIDEALAHTRMGRT